MKNTLFRGIGMGAVSLALACAAHADVKLPALFSDGMVLQREMPVPIWGTADAGEAVTVTVGAQKLETTADAEGKWKVTLQPLAVGAPFEVTVQGKNAITLRNVVAGEVWLASGQSNMAWSVDGALFAAEEMAAANYPNIRMFQVEHEIAAQPKQMATGQWLTATPTTVGPFSAVGYFFARDLQKTLNVPVGILHASWGGTFIEAWTRDADLRTDPDFAPMLEWQGRVEADFPKLQADYERLTAEWKTESEKAKAEGKPEPKAPNPPENPMGHNRPSGLYNGMIAPLVPYAMRGAIWYQGESNAARGFQYRKLMPNLIRSWRADWKQEFPFLLVQLASFTDHLPQPAEDYWAELREAQSMTLSVPKTGMAVAIDIGDAADIHPKNKQEVGRRLSLAALAQVYGQNIPYSGPVYDSMSIEGKMIRLKFKYTDGGVVLKDGPTESFAIAGEDKKWVWAQAKVEGNDVLVWSDAIEKPVAARYAWAINPHANLYNEAGLPASPFRTDNWPGITEANKRQN
jgi:sialate O-acetylesterase